jgi:hypothetical protein
MSAVSDTTGMQALSSHRHRSWFGGLPDEFGQLLQILGERGEETGPELKNFVRPVRPFLDLLAGDAGNGGELAVGAKRRSNPLP